METILCPKCGTETDASQTQCIYCGKIIIAEKMLQTPKKVDEQIHSASFNEMARKLDKLRDDDLFGELEPMGDGQSPADDPFEAPLTPEDIIEENNQDVLVEEEADEGDDAPKKFVNPMAKSKMMRKIKEDQDLFGSLDE